MEKSLSLIIVDKIMELEIPEYFENGIDENLPVIKEYEKLFKCLAIMVDGMGSLLWNMNPDTEFEEMVPNVQEWRELESRWLKEVGLDRAAEMWLLG